jgi:ubiquinone/menaquinone biosynthesis C-methylase UbiE
MHIRLLRQDALLTQAMGGPLAEQSEEHLERIYDVLDIGCGCGGWALQIAHRYPEMTVVGIDCNHTFIQCAQSFAQMQELENVSFQVMDANQPLPLPHASFDLVNIRLLGNTLPFEQWEPLVKECRRLLRPGGILRMTEAEWGCVSMTSPAFTRLFTLTMEAVTRSQPCLSLLCQPASLTPLLLHFLRGNGFEAVQGVATAIDHSSGTEGHLAFASEYLLWFQVYAPTMIEEQILTQALFDELFLQASDEIQTSQFRALLYLFTAWGENQRMTGIMLSQR